MNISIWTALENFKSAQIKLVTNCSVLTVCPFIVVQAPKRFTDASDSHQGYEWNLWIWATDDCALGPDEFEDMTFTITNVELTPLHAGKYPWEVNITVEES